MLSRASEVFKVNFLKELTRQLIINSSPVDVYKLKDFVQDEEEKLKEQKKQKRKEIRENIRENSKENITNHHKNNILPQKVLPKKIDWIQKNKRLPKIHTPKKRVLRVPSVKLPPHLQYLKPVPNENAKTLDLGKINPLIKNPLVTDIQCNGPDKNIVAMGTKGTKETSIILTKNDIDEIYILIIWIDAG